MDVATQLRDIFRLYHFILVIEMDDGCRRLFSDTSHALALEYSNVFNATLLLSPSERRAYALSCGINHVLMTQYAKKRARQCGLPYKQLKMRLTLSERALIKRCFRNAKRDFDKTQNKPRREGTFYAAYGFGEWRGYEVRMALFQHHLARSAPLDRWLYKSPKRFWNSIYASDHPFHAGKRPVPHLQTLNPRTKRWYTKYTMEYPVNDRGQWGCVPQGYHPRSKGPARTLTSFTGRKIRFEGVISHANGTKDRYNHYLTAYCHDGKVLEKKDDL